MSLPEAQLCHFGLYAHDLEKMVAFYTRVLGLVETDRGHSKRGFDIAFLSRRADEHHQVAIVAGRPEDATFSTINQLSFRVNSLEDLRRYYAPTWRPAADWSADLRRKIDHVGAV